MDNQPGNQTNHDDPTTNPRPSEEHQGGFEPVTEPDHTKPDVEDDSQQEQGDDHENEVEPEDDENQDHPGP